MKRLLMLAVLVLSQITFAEEKTGQIPAEKSAEQPEHKPKTVTRIGVLAKEVLQHPDLAIPLGKQKQEQFYFDVEANDKEKEPLQIVVLYPVDMKIPTEANRRIELTGTIQHISLGGAQGTKNEYSNDVMTLHKWKYLDK